jgi:trans-aconitate 2-methyltransferase
MTEWNAKEYARLSGLQRAMAEEVLAVVPLHDKESILDVGCGNGTVTAEIAARVPQGRVLGVDASEQMIRFANLHFGGESERNLHFEVADARKLPFQEEFDLVVSFNALHWIPEQDEVLRSIRTAMRISGRAHLRLVPAGKRRSLEDVIEETRRSPKWARYFSNFHDPYLHLTSDEYVAAAERAGLHVCHVHTADHVWDFGSRQAFAEFGAVTFVAWAQHLPEAERPVFVEDVLDRYRQVVNSTPGEENVFKFYQMDISAVRD